MSIANGKIDGSVVTLSFGEGRTVEVDTQKLPHTQQVRRLSEGTLAALRASYLKAEDSEVAFKAASARAAAMLDDTWRPSKRGPSKSVQHDDWVLAVSEAIDKPAEFVAGPWLDHQLAKHGSKDSAGKTKGKKAFIESLRMHEKVAPILSRMAAERARAARGRQGVSLELDTVEQAAAE